MNFNEIKSEGYVPTYTYTDFTNDLHGIFELHTDYEIVTLKDMKKYSCYKKRKDMTLFTICQIP